MIPIAKIDTAMFAEFTSPPFRDDPNVGSSMLIRYLAVIVAASAFATVASAQSAAEHIAAGDKAAVALNASAALVEYKAAIAADAAWLI